GPGGAASAGVGVGPAVWGRLVAAPALESAQGPPQRAGRGTAPVAAPRGNSAPSLGMAGRRRKAGVRPGAEGGYVRSGSAPDGQPQAVSGGLGSDCPIAVH